MPFGFNRREDAETALRIVRDPPKRPPAKIGTLSGPPATPGYIFQTPSGGIAARSGTTCGSAACTPYYIDPSGAITELTDNGGSSQTQTVYNIFATAIGGSAYITAKQVFGVLVADAEDCA